MAAIDIPDSYWELTPPVFEGLVQNFGPAFAAIDGDLGSAFDGVSLADTGDTGGAVAVTDGDADVINGAVGDGATSAAAGTQNGPLDAYAPGDALTGAAESAVGTVAANTPGGGGATIADPPSMPDGLGGGDLNSLVPGDMLTPPHDFVPNPPPPPSQGAPPEPPETPGGGGEPPTPLPATPTVPLVSGPMPGSGGEGGGDQGSGEGLAPVADVQAIGPAVQASRATPAPPIYVTHEQLANTLAALDWTINVMV
jgi:hypothetical protein